MSNDTEKFEKAKQKFFESTDVTSFGSIEGVDKALEAFWKEAQKSLRHHEHKSIYDLNVHEHTTVNLGPDPIAVEFGLYNDWEVTVLKVHNGWVYIDLDDSGPVFVPKI